MACAAMCLTGCNGFKSQKVELTDDVYSFTALSENKDTLFGVCRRDGSEIIAPQAGVKFSIDRDHYRVLIAIPDDGSTCTYYTLTGKPITDAPIRDFKAPDESYDQLVFIGNTPTGQYVIYFPEGEETIVTAAQFIDAKSATLGYQTDEGFVLRSLKSDAAIYTVKDKDACFITAEGAEPKVVVPQKKTAVIYSLSGEKEKSIPIFKFNQALKQALATKTIGTLRCYNLKKQL